MSRTLIGLLLVFIGGIGFGYKATKTYYSGEIAKEKLAYEKTISEEKARGEKAVASYIERLRAQTERTSSFREQARNTHTLGSGSTIYPNTCFVSYGFIRLFNSSATGIDSAPTEFDSTPSTVELTTVLTTIIANHGKYREAAEQINAINFLTKEK